jgi:predicted amidohydrolase
MNFTIALGQIDSIPGDLAKNVASHVSMAEQAARKGATLIVFPELSLTGYSVKDMTRDLALRPNNPPNILSPLVEQSRSISIIAGAIEEASSFRLYNSALLFEDGSVRSVHRKTYPPTYGMFDELRYFSSGKTVRSFTSKVGTLGALICEDLWHLPLPYLLAQDGATVIITLVASPTRLSGDEHDLRIRAANTENHRAYARLLSCYIVFCNRVGFEDGINFWGGSEVVAPDGTIIASGKQFDEDLVLATINAKEVRRTRLASRHFLDDDPTLVLRELQRLYSHAE